MAIVDLYPTSLRLLGRPVLVVGGGTVAARRAKALLDAGAQVTLVAPDLCAPARELTDAGLVRWLARSYESEDMVDAWYAVAATNNVAVDKQVAADAEANRVWCVNHSSAQESAAWTPAVATVEDVKVAVNAGGDPLRAVAIRNAIAAALETGDLPLQRYRKSPGVEPVASPGVEPVETRISAGSITGSVALVGGGPGAEDLITVRGRRLLAEADVVVADRLGPRGLLETLGENVKIIEVGKTPGHHPVPQVEINAILVREAKAGNRVVRLKGGDPYVLGRGGEEAIACRESGVDVEVVPGVTSAVSVPAAAGIPVTHRGLAKAFTMISGHEELENVPHGSDHTVVLLMGVGTLNRSMPILEAAGRGSDCPVAIVENGFAKNQRVTIGTLGTIVSLAQASQVRNPAVVVVGDVVRVSPLAPAAIATAHYGTRETISSLS